MLEEIRRLTPAERLTLAETVLRLIREDLRRMAPPLTRVERRQRLALAAEALRLDYATGGELTAFTALDGENFHAEG
jgi:hypothetical protein